MLHIHSMKASLAIVVLLFFGTSYRGQGAIEDPGGASPWERAAMNRDSAARALSNQALIILAGADELRQVNDGDTRLRRQRFSQVGGMELTAGGLFLRAHGNFIKAATNWSKARDELRKTDAGLSHVPAVRASRDDSHISAQHACVLAAQSFERAAGAYAVGHAGDLVKAGLANEKAAECREIIAANQAS
jgi:hypothetical protein